MKIILIILFKNICNGKELYHTVPQKEEMGLKSNAL